MPVGMILKIDREANARGMSRQSLIKAWLYEMIEEHGMAQSYERLKKERDRLVHALHADYTVEDSPLNVQRHILLLQEVVEALRRANEQSKGLTEKIKR
jgi:hypothetical protein